MLHYLIYRWQQLSWAGASLVLLLAALTVIIAILIAVEERGRGS